MKATTMSPKRIKYLYTDVIDFTKDRSVEAQVAIIEAINDSVKRTVGHFQIDAATLVFLPSGDGMCIAFLDESLEYDITIRFALKLLEFIENHNISATDPMVKFALRVGANENVDDVVTDINGKTNVTGAGINVAQRVMAVADSSQIIVSEVVYETLRHRQRYMKCFRKYLAKTKHHATFPVYHFIEEGHIGLSVEVSGPFKTVVPVEKSLTQLEAYYLAHAIRNRTLYSQYSHQPQSAYSITVLNWFLAHDSLELTHPSIVKRPSLWTHGKGSINPEEALRFYLNSDFWLCAQLAHFIRETLSAIAPLIDEGVSLHFWVVNRKGIDKLRNDHPDIWQSLGLS